MVVVGEQSHILLIDDVGKIIHLLQRMYITMGRQAKGVRLIPWIRVDGWFRLLHLMKMKTQILKITLQMIFQA